MRVANCRFGKSRSVPRLLFENGPGMTSIPVIFNLVLLLCTAYASTAGGKTGISGSIIFISATLLTIAANKVDPSWGDTAYGIFTVDVACTAALAVLALKSNRFWPIWALGFQIGAVGTHLATIWMPEIVPQAYQALATFWSIPILWVMVVGTHLDRRHEVRIRRGDAANRPT
jgi:hypothetical protein